MYLKDGMKVKTRYGVGVVGPYFMGGPDYPGVCSIYDDTGKTLYGYYREASSRSTYENKDIKLYGAANKEELKEFINNY